MRNIQIHYFAILREQRGLNEESLETAASTAADLYEELRARHGFSLPLARMRVIVNDSFVDWAHALADGDRVVFVPPVAGG